jgi:hypothetical protein
MMIIAYITMLFDNTCMLRIGRKPIYANQLNLAKT